MPCANCGKMSVFTMTILTARAFPQCCEIVRASKHRTSRTSTIQPGKARPDFQSNCEIITLRWQQTNTMMTSNPKSSRAKSRLRNFRSRMRRMRGKMNLISIRMSQRSRFMTGARARIHSDLQTTTAGLTGVSSAPLRVMRAPNVTHSCVFAGSHARVHRGDRAVAWW